MQTQMKTILSFAAAAAALSYLDELTNHNTHIFILVIPCLIYVDISTEPAYVSVHNHTCIFLIAPCSSTLSVQAIPVFLDLPQSLFSSNSFLSLLCFLFQHVESSLLH